MSCNWYQDGDDDKCYECVVLHIDVESHTTNVRSVNDGDEIEDMDMSWKWIMTTVLNE